MISNHFLLSLKFVEGFSICFYYVDVFLSIFETYGRYGFHVNKFMIRFGYTESVSSWTNTDLGRYYQKAKNIFNKFHNKALEQIALL